MSSEKNDGHSPAHAGVVPPEFVGISPDGRPAIFRLAEGRWYANVCPDCGESNGGGIETEKHRASRSDDPFSPTNVPCMWCGKGPMVVKYYDED